MDIWFWSDPHMGHHRIITYCHRPFINLESMDKVLIDNCNARVKEDDLLIVLGDFCLTYSPKEAPDAPRHAFKHYRDQIKCKNIIFIEGNHDPKNNVKTPIQSMIIKHGGNKIFLTHNPKYAQDKFVFNFCGHLHGKHGKFMKLSYKSTIVDLSVENWNYSPVSYNEIWQSYTQWRKENL